MAIHAVLDDFFAVILSTHNFLILFRKSSNLLFTYSQQKIIYRSLFRYHRIGETNIYTILQSETFRSDKTTLRIVVFPATNFKIILQPTFRLYFCGKLSPLKCSHIHYTFTHFHSMLLESPSD